MATNGISSEKKSTKEVKTTTTTVSIESGANGEAGMCHDHILEMAEQCYEEILKQLANADGDMKNVSSAFDRLVSLLLKLDQQNRDLKTRISQSVTETQKLEEECEKSRTRLRNILNRVSPGTSFDDPLAAAAAINAGVSNRLQTLVKVQTEHDLLKKSVDDRRKEIENERERFEEIKKLVGKALSVFKDTFGDSGVENVRDMVSKSRQLMEEERRGNSDALKRLQVCRQVIDPLKWELSDVAKILSQLFTKCEQIDRDVTDLELQGAKVPAYRPGGDDVEQFNTILGWLVDTTDRLFAELRDSKKRLTEAEAEQQKHDADSRKTNEDLKKATQMVDDLNAKGLDIEGRLIGERNASEATAKIMQEQRAAQESQLKYLKQLCDDERNRSKQMTDLLQTLINELNAALEQAKKDQTAGDGVESPLVKKVEQLLAELAKLQRGQTEDSKGQQEHIQQLEFEEKEINEQLEIARRNLKAANEKRDSLAEDLRKMKGKLDSMLQSDRDIEQQLSGFNEERIKVQAEIARLETELGQLRKKADVSQRTLEMREQMLKEKQEQQASMEKAVKDFEKKNERLRWKGNGPEPASVCSKCEDTGNLQQHADTLKMTISNVKKEMDTLLRNIDEATKEAERLRIRRNIGSSAESRVSSTSEATSDERSVESPVEKTTTATTEPGTSAAAAESATGPSRVARLQVPDTKRVSVDRTGQAYDRNYQEEEEIVESGASNISVQLDAKVTVTGCKSDDGDEGDEEETLI